MSDSRVTEQEDAGASRDGWWLVVCLASFLIYLACSTSVRAFVHEIARLNAKFLQ